MVRTRVRSLDVRRNERVDSIASEDQTLKGRYFEADCLAGVVVGDFVRVAASLSGVPQVAKVDITVRGQYPALGVIVEKSSSTKCLVVASGEIITSGLTPGATYWVGLDSRLSATPPVPTIGGIAACQVVGHALTPTQIVIAPNLTPIIRTG